MDMVQQVGDQGIEARQQIDGSKGIEFWLRGGSLGFGLGMWLARTD